MIDLFAGAGGMSVGFEQAGFKSLLSIDFDRDSCLTYQKNFPEAMVWNRDIATVSDEEIKSNITEEVDLIVGGPPCQGFSALGKQQKDDSRNKLWKEYLRIVRLLKPKVWIMENVPELLKSQEFEEINKEAENLGYEICAKVLNAADYGVPQRRQRAFIIASKKPGLSHPEPTHINPEEKNLFSQDKLSWVTAREAFKGLLAKPNGINWHIGRNPTGKSLERYKSIPEGGNRFDLPKKLQPKCWLNKPTGSTDVFGRLWWDKPSLTIRTEFYKPEKGRYLHPSENRPITLREGARLQTFPDSFMFVGSHTSVGRQIGNAVPCLLAHKVAREVKKFLNNNYDLDSLASWQTLHNVTKFSSVGSPCAQTGFL